MSVDPSESRANVAEVHSVLVMVPGDALLLPNIAVAELQHAEAIRRTEDGPAWYLGRLDWNGLSLPVLRLEVLNGETAEADERRARVLVLRMPTPVHGREAIAILALGYPHLVTLRPSAVRAEALRDTDRSDLVLARARIGTQSAWIPDFEAIAELLEAHV